MQSLQKSLDKLSDNNKITSFTKPVKNDKRTYYQWNGVWTHRKCASKIETPIEWNKQN